MYQNAGCREGVRGGEEIYLIRFTAENAKYAKNVGCKELSFLTQGLTPGLGRENLSFYSELGVCLACLFYLLKQIEIFL